MAEPRIFAKGIFFNDKHEKAPDFVLGSISISAQTIAELAAQVEEYKNDKWYARFQITRSRDGKPCISVDTYVPKLKVEDSDESDYAMQQARQRSDFAKSKSNEISIEDIPF